MDSFRNLCIHISSYSRIFRLIYLFTGSWKCEKNISPRGWIRRSQSSHRRLSKQEVIGSASRRVASCRRNDCHRRNAAAVIREIVKWNKRKGRATPATRELRQVPGRKWIASRMQRLNARIHPSARASLPRKGNSTENWKLRRIERWSLPRVGGASRGSCHGRCTKGTKRTKTKSGRYFVYTSIAISRYADEIETRNGPDETKCANEANMRRDHPNVPHYPYALRRLLALVEFREIVRN